MKRVARLAWLVALAPAACREAATANDDCSIVLGDPAHAPAEIAKRYPGQPVKIAEVIERCVAPFGDDCQRLAAIWDAIPTMMTTPPLGADRDRVALCLGMPLEMRHCMLPSYVLAHEAECSDVRTKIAHTPIDRIDIQPRSGEPECDGGTIAVYVKTDGVWLGTGTAPHGRCYAARHGGALDLDWLERQLHHYDAHPCRPDVEVAADRDVPYRDVIAVMDRAIKVGLSNVALSTPGELVVALESADADGAPSACTGDSVKHASAPSVAPRGAADPLVTAPVVIITRTELTLRVADHDTSIGPVSELVHVTGKLDALARALPSRAAGGMIILQADQDTPAGLITHVVSTVKDEGYDNVLFAVKNK
ncbi:MAG TPA: biopolymer transporter ExbD [Kofleriaceae bacterium]|nr:biopolymer transporter ExbD [Kofleriaceae bacterium]